MNYPNTNGTWQSPAGVPLLEVRADDTNTITGTRPAGFADISGLTNDGDRAAFEYELQGFCFGLAKAEAYKATLGFWTPQPHDANDPPAIVDAKVKYAADNDANRVAFERALSTGKYTTPLSPPITSPVAPSDYQGGASASPLAFAAASASTETPPAVTPQPAITHPDQLTPALAAPSSERDTHVIVPNEHVSFFHRLASDVEHGIVGAEHRLVDAIRRVFRHAA